MISPLPEERYGPDEREKAWAETLAETGRKVNPTCEIIWYGDVVNRPQWWVTWYDIDGWKQGRKLGNWPAAVANEFGDWLEHQRHERGLYGKRR